MIKLFKLILRLFLVVIIVGALIIYGLYKKYENSINTAVNDSSEKIEFIVEAGSGANQIIDSLSEAKLIPENAVTYLKVYFRFAKLPQMQEGTFTIPKNLTPIEILETLQNPDSTDIWVTVREGLRKDEIVEILKLEFVDSSDFSAAEFISLTTDVEYIDSLDLGVKGLTELEGYLYPDKYRLASSATAKDIIEAMITNLKDKVGSPTYEQMIIASMVEREGKTDTDRPMIADVISRRLEEGWLLQIDATLLYYHNDWKHVITVQDKEIDHPYNSYLKIGLPPTPISNPGEKAIKAAINPSPNPYYYYIHDDSGQAHFAKTLSEHNLNIQEYLR